jgi:antitoxin component of MazEF toxin-antitoxin module
MTQKVLRVGSSAAVTIPKKSLALLGLKIGDRVNVDVDVKRQTFVVARNTSLTPEDANIARLTASFMHRYEKDLRNLAQR